MRDRCSTYLCSPLYFPFCWDSTWLKPTLPSPPKIKSVSVIDNPFPDIIPRITAAEKRAQQRAREAAQHEREEAERRKGAKKSVRRHVYGHTHQ